MTVSIRSALLMVLILGYAPIALSQDNTVDLIKTHAERSLAPIHFYFKNRSVTTAQDFSDLGKRIITTQGFNQLQSPLLSNCKDEKKTLVMKNGVLMTKDTAREIEEVESLGPPGWKLILLMDVSTSGGGLPNQPLPKKLSSDLNRHASNYYQHLQKIGQTYSAAQVKERTDEFMKVMVHGWTETKPDGNTVSHPSYINVMGLDPQNPKHFEAFVVAFSQVLSFKPYDLVKLEEDRTTDFGVIDALTTNVRSGVCTDFATWIAELIGLSGVDGFTGGDFKKYVGTTSHTPLGSGHAMGKIRDPHTGEEYTINYDEILKMKDGSLVPIDQIFNDQGFGFTNGGITINRGQLRTDKNGKITATKDEMSGISLTPFGKELQTIAYDDKSFDNLQIQSVTGVMRAQKATAGARVQRAYGTQTSNNYDKESVDIGVSYIDMGGIEGAKNTERAMLWARYKTESHEKKADNHYQIFLGGGGGGGLDKFGMLDIAGQMAPKRTYNLKFLNPQASITFQGLTGFRAFLYVQTNVDKEFYYKKIDREKMTLYDPETGKSVATYNPNDYSSTPLDPNTFDPSRTYKIRDEDTKETWLYADRKEIVPYQYAYDRSEDITKYSISGNLRNFNSLKTEIKLNENFTVFGEGILGMAPSTNNISAARGSVKDKAKTFYVATEQGYRTGAKYTQPLKNGSKLITSGSYKRVTNPFGYRQFGEMRLDYVQGTKDLFIYFNSSRFNDYTQTGANNFDEYGVGYRGPIFNGATGNVNAGVVHYPQTNMDLIQGTLRMGIGGKSKKK